MNKFLATIVIFTLPVTYSYADDIKELDVGCENVLIDIGNTSNHELYAIVSWETSATFPNPQQQGSYGNNLGYKKFQFTCPNYSATYDGDKLSIKADSLETALGLITSEFDPTISLYYLGWSSNPYADNYVPPSYPYTSSRGSTSYSFNPHEYGVRSGKNVLIEGQDLRIVPTSYHGGHIDKEVMIGYRVNNGELKPLLYDMKLAKGYSEEMLSADVIDVYHYSPKKYGSRLQRIHLDKKNGLVELYKKHPFPKD